MKLLIHLLFAGFLTSSARATLVLTIDTGAKTVAWSGSFTTAEISTSGFDFTTFYLANSLTSNPNPSPLKIVTGSSETLGVMASNFDNLAFNATSPGQINITENIGLISVFLASAVDFEPDTYTFTANVADGSAKSYADFNVAETAFLESLDGASLDLVRRGDNSPTNTLIGIAGGGSAATITVVPEPSALLLGAIGSLAFLRRRR